MVATHLSDHDLLVIYAAIQRYAHTCDEHDNWSGDYLRRHMLDDMLANRNQWWALIEDDRVLAAIRIEPWAMVSEHDRSFLRKHPGWHHDGWSYASQLISLEKGAGARLLKELPCPVVGDVLVNDVTRPLVDWYTTHPCVSFCGRIECSRVYTTHEADGYSLLVQIIPEWFPRED